MAAAGLGLKHLATVTGVSHGALSKLIYGTQSQGSREPSRRVRRSTAEKILAVSAPTAADLAGGALVDATGTRRRVQTLHAIGWSVARLADQAGLDRQCLDAALRGSNLVRASTATAVAGLYRELAGRPAPTATRAQATSATRARRRARRAGWVSPIDWDPAAIDDPTAEPDQVEATGDSIDEIAVLRAVEGDRTVRLFRNEKVAAIGRLNAWVLSDSQIAERLGIAPRTVHRLRKQHGIAPVTPHLDRTA